MGIAIFLVSKGFPISGDQQIECIKRFCLGSSAAGEKCGCISYFAYLNLESSDVLATLHTLILESSDVLATLRTLILESSDVLATLLILILESSDV